MTCLKTAKYSLIRKWHLKLIYLYEATNNLIKKKQKKKLKKCF